MSSSPPTPSQNAPPGSQRIDVDDATGVPLDEAELATLSDHSADDEAMSMLQEEASTDDDASMPLEERALAAPFVPRPTEIALQKKHKLRGRYVHTLENTKSKRTEEQTNPPHLKITERYHEDIKANRLTRDRSGPAQATTTRKRSRRPLVPGAAKITVAPPMPQMPPLQIPPPRPVSPIVFPQPSSSSQPPVSGTEAQSILPSPAMPPRPTSNVYAAQSGAPPPAIPPRPPGHPTQNNLGPQPQVQEWSPPLSPEQIVYVVRVVHALYNGGKTAMSIEQAWATWLKTDNDSRKKIFALYHQYQSSRVGQPPGTAASAGADSSTSAATTSQKGAIHTGPMHTQPPRAEVHAAMSASSRTSSSASSSSSQRTVRGYTSPAPQGWSEPTPMNTDNEEIVLPFATSYASDLSAGGSASDLNAGKSTRGNTRKNAGKGKGKASAAHDAFSLCKTDIIPKATTVEDNEKERPPQPVVQERTLNTRPTPQPPTNHAFAGADLTELLVGRIHHLTEAVSDQAEAQKMFAGQLKDMQDMFSGMMLKNTEEPATKPKTWRDEKLAGDSPRQQKKDRRVQEKVEKQRGRRKKDDQAMPVEEPEDVHLNRLKSRVRHTLAEMLQIVDWKHVATQYPKLTEEQIDAYLARDPTIVPTMDKFRVDFAPGHGWKTFSYNKEARHAFIDKYFSRVEGGAFWQKPTPPELLTREQVGMVLDAHMKYCRDLWRTSKTPPTEADLLKLARRICRNARRSTLYESREVTLVRRGYQRHRALFRLLEPANMSGDETDGPEKKHPPVWRIVIARWQSEELRNFLWALDRMYREDWARKRVGGNPPRVRVLRANSEEEGYPAHGLWKNCYDQAWFESQPAHVQAELEVVDEDYDFTL